MKTTDLNQSEKSNKNIAFVNFTSAKRLHWDRYRRYGIFV